jgi:hypothetical protein
LRESIQHSFRIGISSRSIFPMPGEGAASMRGRSWPSYR